MTAENIFKTTTCSARRQENLGLKPGDIRGSQLQKNNGEQQNDARPSIEDLLNIDSTSDSSSYEFNTNLFNGVNTNDKKTVRNFNDRDVRMNERQNENPKSNVRDDRMDERQNENPKSNDRDDRMNERPNENPKSKCESLKYKYTGNRTGKVVDITIKKYI